MLTYAKLKRDRRKCVAVTRLTPKEFEVLLPAFARAYAEHYPAEKTMTGKPQGTLSSAACRALRVPVARVRMNGRY
jgi:hypothetical protein